MGSEGRDWDRPWRCATQRMGLPLQWVTAQEDAHAASESTPTPTVRVQSSAHLGQLCTCTTPTLPCIARRPRLATATHACADLPHLHTSSHRLRIAPSSATATTLTLVQRAPSPCASSPASELLPWISLVTTCSMATPPTATTPHSSVTGWRSEPCEPRQASPDMGYSTTPFHTAALRDPRSQPRSPRLPSLCGSRWSWRRWCRRRRPSAASRTPTRSSARRVCTRRSSRSTRRSTSHPRCCQSPSQHPTPLLSWMAELTVPCCAFWSV